MGSITKITRQTNNRFLNMYDLDNVHKSGKKSHYFMASRAKSDDDLKLVSHTNKPDGVVIYAVTKEENPRIVLVKQYRYPIDAWIYELPAGLVEDGEDIHVAGIREMKEETGMTFTPLDAPKGYERPFFTSVGLTDESCSTIFGFCTGEPTSEGEEESEEIEVVLADKAEAARILREENCCMRAGYMLPRFIADDEPFAFLHV